MKAGPAPYPPIDGTQACASADPEIFFPALSSPGRAPGWEVRRALAVCAACPFLTPCGAFALTHDVIGIWGGTTAEQRQAWRRRRGFTPAPVFDYRFATTTTTKGITA